MKYILPLSLLLVCCGDSGSLVERGPMGPTPDMSTTAPPPSEPPPVEPVEDMTSPDPPLEEDAAPDMPQEPPPSMSFVGSSAEITTHETLTQETTERVHATFNPYDITLTQHGSMEGFGYPETLEGGLYLTMHMEPELDHVDVMFEQVPITLGFSRSFRCPVLLDFDEVSVEPLEPGAAVSIEQPEMARVRVRREQPGLSTLEMRAKLSAWSFDEGLYEDHRTPCENLLSPMIGLPLRMFVQTTVRTQGDYETKAESFLALTNMTLTPEFVLYGSEERSPMYGANNWDQHAIFRLEASPGTVDSLTLTDHVKAELALGDAAGRFELWPPQGESLRGVVVEPKDLTSWEAPLLYIGTPLYDHMGGPCERARLLELRTSSLQFEGETLTHGALALRVREFLTPEVCVRVEDGDLDPIFGDGSCSGESGSCDTWGRYQIKALSPGVCEVLVDAPEAQQLPAHTLSLDLEPHWFGACE